MSDPPLYSAGKLHSYYHIFHIPSLTKLESGLSQFFPSQCFMYLHLSFSSYVSSLSLLSATCIPFHYHTFLTPSYGKLLMSNFSIFFSLFTALYNTFAFPSVMLHSYLCTLSHFHTHTLSIFPLLLFLHRTMLFSLCNVPSLSIHYQLFSHTQLYIFTLSTTLTHTHN